MWQLTNGATKVLGRRGPLPISQCWEPRKVWNHRGLCLHPSPLLPHSDCGHVSLPHGILMLQ